MTTRYEIIVEDENENPRVVTTATFEDEAVRIATALGGYIKAFQSIEIE